jgi:uncharacterized repeat protein (TIGR01451 family)
MNKITKARSLLLVCCAVGTLFAANQSWADTTITNCAQVTAATETDIDSTPNNKADDQAIITALATTPPSNEDDEACAPVTLTSIFDFGDAPDKYGTTTAADGAKHEIVSGLKLGASVDNEADGQPNTDATGDGTDEDGVTIPPLMDGDPLTINVVATNTTSKTANIGCWIDYNGDGVFAADASEFGSGSVPVGSSNVTVNIPMPAVPADASTKTGGASYARCRLSTDAITATNMKGALTDGEVEDYKVTFTAKPVFDLALRKKLATGQATSVKAGDTVKYSIEVLNQGTVAASNIEVVDYIPAGMTLADANWTDNKDGTATLKTPIASLAATGSAFVEISLKLDTTVKAGIINNSAEISKATPATAGLTDIDSTPDTTNSDNVVNDVVDNSGSDEDDHDIEPITVLPTVDIELAKSAEDTLGTKLATTQHGGTIVYVLTATNKGVDPATNVTINDTLPTSLTYVSDTGGGAYNNSTGAWSVGSLAAGESKSIKITATVK